MAGPLGLNADERQLSALELMMEHADSLSADVIGAPKPRRRRRQQQDTISARDFMRNVAHTEDYEDYEYYVGPGSRALNRELRERRMQQRGQQRTQGAVAAQPSTALVPVASEQSTARPSNEEMEKALENIFTANRENGTDIVQALHQNTQISAQTAKTLHDWMEWEKNEAFKNANRDRSVDAAPEPTKNLPAVPGDNSPGTDLSLPDADFPDEGRDRGNRRRGRRYGRNRRGPGGRPRPRGRGKWGALLGLAAVGGAFWWANKEKGEQDGTDGDMPDQQQPVNPEIAAQPQPKPGMTQEQKDAAFSATSLGALAIGGAKKIPFVGPAVALAGAGYNAEQIANDDTLSEAEKSRAQTKNITSSAGGGIGATAGAWIGGTLGSVVPGAGTLAGAALGSVIGGLIGDALGDKVGDAVADKMDESNEKAEEAEKKRQDELKSEGLLGAASGSMMPNWFSGMFSSIGNFFGGGGRGGGGGGTNVARPAQFDSKQISEFAAKASKGGLGSVSAQFESGGRGVGTISSGAGDYGGVSYGAHQLATNNGSMMNFLNSKEGQQFAAQFGGQAPGTAGFNEAYKGIVANNGDAFAKAQDDYITRTHYAPQAAKLQNDLGLDVSKRGKAVQEMVYSTAVQYGGNTNAIKRALNGLDLDKMTDEQIINTVQQSKAQNVGTDFKSSSANVQAGVAARAENERKVLTELNKNDKQDQDIAQKFPELKDKKGTGNPADYEAKPVDAQPVPDLTARGPVLPKRTDAENEAKMRDMFPDKVQKRADEMGATALDATPRTETQRNASPEELAAARRRFNEETFGPRVMEDQKKITPIEREPAPVERQPLVTAADIPQPSAPPQPVAQQEAPAAKTPGVVGRSSGGAAPSGGGAAKTHTMDDIPVFLDDPTLQMINVGYM